MGLQADGSVTGGRFQAAVYGPTRTILSRKELPEWRK